MEETLCVEQVTLSEQLDRRVAVVSIRIGQVRINKVAVWRSGNGKLKVFLPAHRGDRCWIELVELPPDLRRDVEQAVIAAYEARKAERRSREYEISNN